MHWFVREGGSKNHLHDHDHWPGCSMIITCTCWRHWLLQSPPLLLSGFFRHRPSGSGHASPPAAGAPVQPDNLKKWKWNYHWGFLDLEVKHCLGMPSTRYDQLIWSTDPSFSDLSLIKGHFGDALNPGLLCLAPDMLQFCWGYLSLWKFWISE